MLPHTLATPAATPVHGRRRAGVAALSAAATAAVTALATGLAVLTAASAQASVPAADVQQATSSARADNLGWSSFNRLTWNSHWAAGTTAGVRWQNGTLSIRNTVARLTHAGTTYSYAYWTSAWIRPGRSFTELVPSWAATTPSGTWLQVFVRGRTKDGRVSKFKDLGRWSSRDAGFRRSSAGSQADNLAKVTTDALKTTGPAFNAYQFRVRLLRRNGLDGKPRVTSSPAIRSLHGVASRLPSRYPATSRPLASTSVGTKVPSYSQMTHQGQNPKYGGGGAAWCSPTSLAMVLGRYGKLPPASSYTWVPSGWPDRFVNHVARMTYDYRYGGTGNWPFNTGYAATRIADAFVTRLPDLRAAERLVRKGIPVIISVKFSRGQLDGAPISSTNGHLMVVTGFTAKGDVVVRDPAAPRNATVRRTYKRAQLERVWLNGSGGLTYVVRDGKHPLPPRVPGMPAW